MENIYTEYTGDRKLASIKKISEITPIEGADRIEVAHIDGWKIIVGKNEFKVGDFVVFFEIDSYLPTEARYEFLKERCLRSFSKNGEVWKQGYRIKTCKLRGVISQGLVMPLSAFPEIIERISDFNGNKFFNETKREIEPVNNDSAVCDILVPLEGANVTQLLKIEHYDEVAAPFLSVSVPCGDKASDFPSFIPKSDEERIQNLENPFMEYADKVFEATIKRDGSSLTAFYSPTYSPEAPFGVCSRNMRLKSPDGDKVSKFWEVILKNEYDKKIEAYCKAFDCELAFQGELVGPGIQANRSLFADFEWHIFRIWNIKEQNFVECSCRRKICEQIGLKHVPVIDEGMQVFKKFKTIDEILLFADGMDDRGHMREGIVFKEINTNNPFTFKAVSNKYLLKQE